jgi:hypothetical protein
MSRGRCGMRGWSSGLPFCRFRISPNLGIRRHVALPMCIGARGPLPGCPATVRTRPQRGGPRWACGKALARPSSTPACASAELDTREFLIRKLVGPRPGHL